MLNRVTIIGRVTKDYEVRQTQSGMSYAKFTVACDRDRKDKNTGEKVTDFIDCAVFGKTAEFCGNYVSKGTQICVDGRLQVSSYDNRDGNRVTKYEVVANNVYIVGSSSKGNNNAGSKPSQQKQQIRNPTQAKDNFKEIDDTEDDYGNELPF